MYANILLAHRTFLMEQAEVCYLISSISPLRENVVSKGGLCFVKLYQVDNLMHVLCFPTAGGKSVKKPRFSLRGYDFVPLDVKTDNLCIGEQDGSSAVPSTKASQTMVAERLENVEEQTEDLAPEFALPPKANTSVSELLDNLQRRGGSFVRTPSLVCIVLHSFFILEFLHNTYITSEYFNLVAPTCSKHINQGAGSFIRSATN